MKKTRLCMLMAAVPLLLAGCANDNVSQENDGANDKHYQEVFTEFAAVDENETTGELNAEEAQTRTAGKYTGEKIDFLWTLGDNLWLYDESEENPEKRLKRNDSNDIERRVSARNNYRTAAANFVFKGRYTKDEYSMRYTGSSEKGDEVTIAAHQYQENPADMQHLGKFGDCAVAKAKKQGDRYIVSMMEHKAAYITFVPYSTEPLLANAKITEICVYASEEMTGTFPFNDNGIYLPYDPIDRNNCIKLRVNSFPLPTKPSHELNAATIVLRPERYNRFYVRYKLNVNGIEGTITKEYKDVKFTEGKNKRVETNLQIPSFDEPKLYYWDEMLPNITVDDNVANYNTSPYPAQASNSCASCPNINEILWYMLKGNPYQDYRLWKMNGVLHNGGIWLKKKAEIAFEYGKNKNKFQQYAPDGADYTNNNSHADHSVNATEELPIYLFERYFFLPGMGINGSFGAQDGCAYWSKSTNPMGRTAYGLRVNGTFLTAYSEDFSIINRLPLWTAD